MKNSYLVSCQAYSVGFRVTQMVQDMTLVALLLFVSPVFANESPQALQDAFVAAMEANDAAALAACYTADAVSYPIDAMADTGSEHVLASWQSFFETYKVSHLGLSVGGREVMGDVSVAWGLFTLTAMPRAGGEEVVMKGRYTDVSKNIDGKWLYVFDHASMPLPPAPESTE